MKTHDIQLAVAGKQRPGDGASVDAEPAEAPTPTCAARSLGTPAGGPGPDPIGTLGSRAWAGPCGPCRARHAVGAAHRMRCLEGYSHRNHDDRLPERTAMARARGVRGSRAAA